MSVARCGFTTLSSVSRRTRRQHNDGFNLRAARALQRAARGGRTKVSAAVLLNWNPIINSGGGLHKGATHVEQEQRFGYPR